MEKLLSNRVNRITESATIMMAQKARELTSQGHDVIALSLGEPDFDTPDSIKNAAKRALDNGYTKYTPVPGLAPLREAIAEKFKRENGLSFSTSQIVVSNGAKQSIANICMALLNPGDDIVIFAPYWVSYVDIALFCGANPVIINTDIEQDFLVTPEQLRAAITSKTKAILFSSPCNPTGSVFGKKDLEALVEVLVDYPEVVVISDEIYEYINFGEGHTSIGSFDAVKHRTVTVNGFSKGFSMTGWRLGYLGAPQWLASAASKIQGQTTSGACSFGQMAAIEALKAGRDAYGEMIGAFRRRKDLVMDLLDDIEGIQINNPKGAFYLFPDISALFGRKYNGKEISTSDDFVELILSEAHVALVAGSAFGNEKCFRLSYAASEEQLREAVSRMAKVISGLV